MIVPSLYGEPTTLATSSQEERRRVISRKCENSIDSTKKKKKTDISKRAIASYEMIQLYDIYVCVHKLRNLRDSSFSIRENLSRPILFDCYLSYRSRAILRLSAIISGRYRSRSYWKKIRETVSREQRVTLFSSLTALTENKYTRVHRGRTVQFSAFRRGKIADRTHLQPNLLAADANVGL